MIYKRIIFLLLLIPFFSFSQQRVSGKIIYKYRIVKEVFNSDKKSENIKSVFKGFSENLENSKEKISFELIFNQNESYYKMIKKLESDHDKGLNFAILITGGKEELYTSIKDTIRRKRITAFGETFLIDNNFKNSWKLTQESKKIGKYTCYKAILEKKFTDSYNKEKKMLIEAWYTPEIPVNFGPKGYGNLPGLILELDQGAILYYAQQIELNKGKNIVINPPKNGKIISEEEFSNMFRKIDKKKRNKKY
jgi:GLPGLI family protein